MAKGAELAPRQEALPAKQGERSAATKMFASVETRRRRPERESPIDSITGQFADIKQIPEKKSDDRSDADAVRRATAEEGDNRRAKLTEAFRQEKDVLVCITRRPGSTDVEWSVVVPDTIAEQQRTLTPIPEDTELEADEHTQRRQSILLDSHVTIGKSQTEVPKEPEKEFSAYMKERYEEMGMADGKDRALVEQRAKELWIEHGEGGAPSFADRLRIAEALVGRKIPSDELEQAGDTVPWFDNVVVFGGPYELLEMTTEQVRNLDAKGISLKDGKPIDGVSIQTENAEEVQDAIPVKDKATTLEEINQRYMQKLYDDLEMGDGQDQELVSARAEVLWGEARTPADKVRIVEALAGRRFLDPSDKETAQLFTPGLMDVISEGGTYENLMERITEAVIGSQQEQWENAPIISGMSALYEHYEMGDGSNRELVETKAEEIWNTDLDAAARFNLAHTILGREFDEQDIDNMGEDVLRFHALLNEGGSYQDLKQLIDGVRTRREEELRNTEHMRGLYAKYGLEDGTTRDSVRQKAQEIWESTEDPVDRMEAAELVAGMQFDDSENPRALPFKTPEFMGFLLAGGDFGALVEDIEAKLQATEPAPPVQIIEDGAAPESAANEVAREQAAVKKLAARRREAPKPKQVVLDNGAIAELRAKEEIKERLAEFHHWRHVEVVPTLSPQGEVEGKTKDGMGMSDTGFKLEKLLTNQEPFAVVIRIHPHKKEQIRQSIDHVSELEFEQKQTMDAAAEIKTDSFKALTASLIIGETTGRFDVDVMVGGTSDNGVVTMADTVINGTRAGELASNIDMDKRAFGSMEEALQAAEDKRANPRRDGTIGWIDPNIGVSLEMADRLMPSLLSTEAGGISIYEMVDWALNIPKVKEIPEERRISLGMITDKYGTEISEIVMDMDKLFEHMGIFGTTGKGKSTLVARIAEQLARKGRPVILIDPKGGLAQICADMLEGSDLPVTELALGDLGEALIGINPVDWGENDLSLHIDNFIDTVTSAFDEGEDKQAAETTKRFLKIALRGKSVEVDAKGTVTKPRFIGLYERLGWDADTGKPIIPGTTPMKPNMLHLINVLQEAGDEQGYIMEASNVIKWLVQRQESQGTGKPGQIYSGPPLDMKKMFEPGAVTIVRTDKLSPEQFRLLGTFMIDQFGDLAKHFQDKSKEEGTEWNGAYLFVDEAGLVIRDGTPFADGMDKKAKIYRSRKAGLGLITQSPEGTPAAIRGNINTWLLMKVQTAESLDAVRTPMGLRDPQARHVTRFLNRQFAAFLPDMGMWQPVMGYAPYFLSDGTAPLHPAESLVANYAPERFVKLGDVSELNRRIFESEEGRVLRGVIETNIWMRAMGLDTLVGRGKEFKQQEPGEPNPFDVLKELQEDNPKAFSYMLEKSLDRAVYAHSALFLPLTAHFTLETRENFMSRITEAVQAMDLPDTQQRVLLDKFKSDLNKTTRDEFDDPNNKFLRRFRRSVAEAIGTAEGETFTALSDLVTQTTEVMKEAGEFEYITFDMIKDRLTRDIFAMIKGVPGDASPDQSFMVDESFGSFAAKAMVMEHINTNTPDVPTVVKMDGIEVTSKDITDFIEIRDFIEDNRNELLAGNKALRNKVRIYMIQQKVIAAQKRHLKQEEEKVKKNLKEKVEELSVEDALRVLKKEKAEVTEADIDYFLEDNRGKIEPDKDPDAFQAVATHLYKNKVRAARLRYQRLVEKYPDEQLLTELFGAEVPGETAWEQYIFLKDQAKSTGKIFLAEKFYGIGHMMDSAAGSSLKEAIEKEKVSEWVESLKKFLGSMGAKPGSLDAIFAEIESYIETEIEQKSNKLKENAAKSHVAESSQTTRADASTEQAGSQEQPITMQEALDVYGAYGGLGRLEEISKKSQATQEELHAGLDIIGETVGALGKIGAAAETIEIPDDISGDITEAVSDGDIYGVAQDALEAFITSTDDDIAPELKIKALIVRAKFEKIRAEATKISKEGKVQSNTLLGLFREAVQVHHLVNELVGDNKDIENNSDFIKFMRVYKYNGPFVLALYQASAKQGFSEETIEANRNAGLAQMEDDLAELARGNSITKEKETSEEDPITESLKKIQQIKESALYKSYMQRLNELSESKHTMGVVEFYKAAVKLYRDRADLFSEFLPRPKETNPDATPLERLTDFVSDPATSEVRLMALNDRLSLEQLAIMLETYDSEDMTSDKEDIILNQYMHIANSVLRIENSQDIRLTALYHQAFSSVAPQLLDAYELNTNIVFTNTPDHVNNIRRAAISKMRKDLLDLQGGPDNSAGPN